MRTGGELEAHRTSSCNAFQLIEAPVLLSRCFRTSVDNISQQLHPPPTHQPPSGPNAIAARWQRMSTTTDHPNAAWTVTAALSAMLLAPLP